jgi:hypothetical protein
VTSHPHQKDRELTVSGYREQYVACRSGQHRWPAYGSWHWKVTRGLRGRPLAYRVTLMCEICGCIAQDTIDAHTGDRSRSYRHPEGYRIPAELEVSRSDLRLELVQRLAKNAEPDTDAEEKLKAQRAAEKAEKAQKAQGA